MNKFMGRMKNLVPLHPVTLAACFVAAKAFDLHIVALTRGDLCARQAVAICPARSVCTGSAPA